MVETLGAPKPMRRRSSVRPAFVLRLSLDALLLHLVEGCQSLPFERSVASTLKPRKAATA